MSAASDSLLTRRRAAAAVLAAVIAATGAAGCTDATEEEAPPTTAAESPAPGKADRTAATRAWRSYLRKRGRRMAKSYYAAPGEPVQWDTLKMTTSAEPLRWNNCVHPDAFCASGSVSFVQTSTAVTSKRFVAISGKVERIDGRWVASGK